jgi:drug/metabolite transporter (DMT)-like permease
LSNSAPRSSSAPVRHPNHAFMHVLMFIVIFSWSSNIIAGKEALRHFDPIALAQIRVLAAAAIFAILFLASGRLQRLNLSRRDWRMIVAMAATGIALNQLTFIGGMARTTVAHTGLIVALGPVMVLAIAVIIKLEPLTGWKIAGMSTAFAGVAILTLGKFAGGEGRHLYGDLIELSSVTVFSIYMVLMKEVANDFDGLTINTLTYGLGALMMLPFCARSVLSTHWGAVDLKAWAGLAFLVFFGSILSYQLFAYVMTELAASRVAAFNYLQPVIASALGVWMLSERLTAKVLMGGALILVGVYLTERERGDESVSVNSTQS